MRRRIRLVALSAAALVPAKASVAQSIELTPCHVPGADGEVKCGVFDVRENRADASSRIIPLRVIVIPSRATRPLADPVFMVSPGGPGTRVEDTCRIPGNRVLRRRDLRP